MEDEVKEKTKAGRGLGIAGLIVGICALVLSIIPLVGLIAIYPAVIAVILSVIALIMAIKGNGAKGLIIAALIISIAGTAISAYWMHAATKLVKEIGTEWIDEFGDALEEALEEEDFSELEEVMDELEGEGEEVEAEIEEAEEDAEE